MCKVLFSILSVLLFAAGIATAGLIPPPPTPAKGLRTYTVATLPAANANINLAVIVTDGAAAGDCTTGSGTSRNVCISNGSAWAAAGDGTGGEAAISDAAFGAGWDGDGTHAPSKNAIYDAFGLWAGVNATNPSFSTVTATGAGGLVSGVAGSVQGNLKLYSNTPANSFFFSMYGANFTENTGWRVPASQPAGSNYLLNVDADGTMDYTDPSTFQAAMAAASQAEMETGTEAGLRSMSPLRVAQAIAALAAASSGDVSGVGDCASGACLDGSSDGGTYIRLYDGNSHYTQLAAGDSTGNLTYTLPTAAPAGNNAIVVMATTGAMSTLPSTTYQPLHGYLTDIAAITAAQGDVLYFNGTDWVNLGPGVSGQYLQTQGAGANPQWASTSVSGDVESIGDCLSGACFNGGSGNSLQFEGATANEFEITLTAADPGADYTVTLPAGTGSVVLGPADYAADNRLIRTDYGAGRLTHTQTTGISVDDSNNVSGVAGLSATSLSPSSFIAIGADPADAGAVRLPNAGYIMSESDVAGTDVSVIGVDSSEVIQIGATGASGVTITPALTVTGTLTANGGIVMGTGDGLTVNSVNLLSGDELDGTKIKDADYGDVTINAAGAWAVEDDSHAHGSTTITLASTNLSDTSNVARLDASNTFTGTTNTVGNANTDLLAVQATLRGVGRAVSIDDDTTTAPTYATGTGELFVAGDIEAGGSVYAQSFVALGTGDSYIDLSSNAAYPAGAGNNSFAVVSNAWKLKENGTEKDLVTPDNSVTWTGATQSFAGVTNMVLPTATPDASGEIGMIAGNILAYHDGAAVIKIDTTGVADGKILKWVAANGAFEVADDATAGSPTLDTIGDPAGDTTIEMNAAEEVNFDYTGNFTTGSQFRVRQVTGNPSGGVLFEVLGTDTDITLAKIGDGTNGVTVSAAGALTAAGTGTIVATGLSAGTAPVPAVANGVALGSATNEWADLFLHSGAVIYGEADQSATLTSSASLWTANNFAVTGYLAIGADPADAGSIRLPNAGYIYSEADAAGTDISVIGVDSAERVQIAASGSSGVTITPDTTITGDLTVTGADITLAAAGVKLTGSNGALTILGLGDGQDEDVKIDLNTTANTIIVSSPASSATAVSFSALNLVTTGSIQGGIKISSDADGMDAAAMTAAGMYGTLFIATGAGTWILPTAVAGMSACLMDSGTAHDLVLDATAGDTIRLKGTEGADGATITNATGSTTGDFVCVVAVAANKWSTVGMAGTWTVP